MKEQKKYELTNITMKYGGIILHRIKALKDFNNVKKNDLGGWIEKESNLSQEGNCWIYDNAKVYGDALILGNAQIFNSAEVYDYAWVYGNAKVYDYAWVCGNAEVSNSAKVYGNAEVSNSAQVYGNAEVSNSAQVYGNAKVYNNAKVYGDANLYDYANISNDAIISSKDDYIYINGLGSENRFTTFFKCKDNIIKVNCGCFNGTIEEFIDKVNITHKDNDKYREEYLLLVEVIKRHFNIKGE